MSTECLSFQGNGYETVSKNVGRKVFVKLKLPTEHCDMIANLITVNSEPMPTLYDLVSFQGLSMTVKFL